LYTIFLHFVFFLSQFKNQCYWSYLNFK
jgi:hypothetical protein